MMRPRVFRKWPGIVCPRCGARPYLPCVGPPNRAGEVRVAETHGERWDAVATAEKRAAWGLP